MALGYWAENALSMALNGFASVPAPKRVSVTGCVDGGRLTGLAVAAAASVEEGRAARAVAAIPGVRTALCDGFSVVVGVPLPLFDAQATARHTHGMRSKVKRSI